MILAVLTLPILVIASYLLAAVFGAILPASDAGFTNREPFNGPPVYLIGTLLHLDIAVPVNNISLQKFAFLQEAGVPLNNPELKYLLVGWGSQQFYTETADYSDIRLSTTWTAITGDSSVMHVAPAGDISKVPGVTKVEMSDEGFSDMLDYILEGFQDEGTGPVLLDATYGYGDVFYKSPYHFNIFTPCNIWVGEALERAGQVRGRWTPTSYSVKLANWLHN